MNIQNALQKKTPVLLDGGMGQELIRRGHKHNNCLWSTNALLDAPEAILRIHEDYIAVGAEVITTSNYTTLRSRLAEINLEHRFEELLQQAGKLAQTAQSRAQKTVYVAGCLPPLWRSYRPDLVQGLEEAEKLYTEIIENLDPYCDFYLAETFSTPVEAIAAARVAIRTKKPIWVGWTLRDDGSSTVRNGQDITEVLEAVKEVSIDAYLINCCMPESVSVAMKKMRNYFKKSGRDAIFGAYANGFIPIPPGWKYDNPEALPSKREGLTPVEYLGFVKDWIENGAGIVGGCCEIGPNYIQTIRNYLDQRVEVVEND